MLCSDWHFIQRVCGDFDDLQQGHVDLRQTSFRPEALFRACLVTRKRRGSSVVIILNFVPQLQARTQRPFRWSRLGDTQNHPRSWD